MGNFERRRHNRLAMSLDLLCRKLGAPAQQLYQGRVVNIGTGGLYFETAVHGFEPGNFAEVRLSIPPTTGLLELGGTMRAIAKVLRTQTLSRSRTGLQSPAVQGVAMEFCRRPRLYS